MDGPDWLAVAPDSFVQLAPVARYGPIDLQPDIVTSLGDFEQVYGDRQQLDYSGDKLHNFLWHAVRGFFEEGGKRLYVIEKRLVDNTLVVGDCAEAVRGTVELAEVNWCDLPAGAWPHDAAGRRVQAMLRYRQRPVAAVVASGTPADVMRAGESHTGIYLTRFVRGLKRRDS